MTAPREDHRARLSPLPASGLRRSAGVLAHRKDRAVGQHYWHGGSSELEWTAAEAPTVSKTLGPGHHHRQSRSRRQSPRCSQTLQLVCDSHCRVPLRNSLEPQAHHFLDAPLLPVALCPTTGPVLVPHRGRQPKEFVSRPGPVREARPLASSEGPTPDRMPSGSAAGRSRSSTRQHSRMLNGRSRNIIPPPHMAPTTTPPHRLAAVDGSPL